MKNNNKSWRQIIIQKAIDFDIIAEHESDIAKKALSVFLCPDDFFQSCIEYSELPLRKRSGSSLLAISYNF